MPRPTLVIGNRNYSSWSLRPWILLRHLALEFDEVRLPLDTPQFAAEIGRWSPSGKVPVLVDGDLRVYESLAIVEMAGLEEYGASAMVYAAAARLHVHRRDSDAAIASQAKAMRLRVVTTWTFPYIGVLLRLVLADVQLALNDVDGARILVHEIDEIVHHRPELGRFNDRVDHLRTRVSTANKVLGSGPTLTAAELRIVPYLQTNLTLQEIGDRLYVSRNTVNTHVGSIYRKLQVSSRGEAVRTARDIGLLADGADQR